MNDFTKIQLRHDASLTWTQNNPVLDMAEVGVETDSGKIKIGNGATAWRDLPYLSGASGGSVSWGDITGNVGLSAALVAALNLKESLTNRGAAGGYASLDAQGKIPASAVPATVELLENKGRAGGYPALSAGGKIADTHISDAFEKVSNRDKAGGYVPLDAGKKISSDYLPNTVELVANKGAANGYAPLNEDGLVPAAYLPYVESSGGGSGTVSLPRGLIVMWSGELTGIPTGWALCDGRNGTPNLIDRFIVGIQNATTRPGATGGSNTVTLTADNMPSHKHNFTGGSHQHSIAHGHNFTGGSHYHNTDSHSHSASVTINQNGHSHDAPLTSWLFMALKDTVQRWILHNDNTGTAAVLGTDMSSSASLGFIRQMPTDVAYHEHSGSVTIYSGGGGATSNATVSGSVSAVPNITMSGAVEISGDTSAVGSGAAVDIRPKFFALAYIMKL